MVRLENLNSRTVLLALLSVGLGLGACGGGKSASGDAGVASSHGDAAGEDSGEPDFYAPQTVAQLLSETRSVGFRSLSSPASLSRLAMGPAESTDLVTVSDSDSSVDAALSIASGLAEKDAATQGELLRSMFKLYERASGQYQVIATKHHNYALDAEGENVVLRDWRSSERATDAGLLLFSLRASGDGYVLEAVARQVLADGAYVDDPSWTAAELVVTTTGVRLDTAAGSGTELTLYAPPFDFDIPDDFNPRGVERQPNSELEAAPGEDLLARLPDQIADAYADQVATPGLDAATTAAAEAMLAQIEVDLAAEGASMRYPAEFYLAARAGLLNRVLVSSDNIDGVLGQHTVPYVYFTNETDDEGVHHPMLVAASYNLPDTLGLLWDVSRPPGDGLSDGYASQQVTRNYNRKAFLQRLPLRDYGTVSEPTENMLEASLAEDVSVDDFDVFNYASVGHSGFAIDGVLIYPAYNNTLEFAQLPAEISAHGNHSGRGLGMHYHADANLARGTDTGHDDQMGLYNLADYEGHSHPPIVSLSYDGVAGYGAYLEGDTTSDGAEVALDQFGGHSHGAYGYHYHAYALETEVDGASFTQRFLPPLGAWAGAINDIPGFWDNRQPDTSDRSPYVGFAERPAMP